MPTPIHEDHRMKKSTDTCPTKAAGFSSLFLSRHVDSQNVGALKYLSQCLLQKEGNVNHRTTE